MPEWIHKREKHIKAKNPDMPESEAWAIATKQSKSPNKTTANPKTASLVGFLDEFQKIANILGTGAKYLSNSVGRGFNEGGLLGQALTVAGTGLGIKSEIDSNQDPTGQGRGRAERLTGLAGETAGGLAGQTIGSDIGKNVIRQLDPRDKMLTRAEPKVLGGIAKIKEPLERGAAMGSYKSVMRSKPLGFKAKAFGLRAIPTALGIAGSLYGMHAGNKLFSAPFKPFRTPQPTPQQNQIQSTDQFSTA